MVFTVEVDMTLTIAGDEDDYTVRSDVDFTRDGVDVDGHVEVFVNDAWVRLDSLVSDEWVRAAEDAICEHALEYGPPVDDDDSDWRESRCGW